MITLFKRIVSFINDPLQMGTAVPTHLCDQVCQKLSAQTKDRYYVRPRDNSIRENQYDIVKM